FNISKFQEKMSKSLEKLKQDMQGLRIGRAHPSLLESIKVEMGNQKSVLGQISNINVKDAQTLMVVVSDEQLLKIAEKAIRNANLSLNPQKVDSTVLKVPVPKMSADYKDSLLKNLAQLAEKCRSSVRSVRTDARKSLKALKMPDKDNDKMEKEIQQMTDKYNKEIEQLLDSKKKDL
ncbi:ribosome recycling factor, partial [Gorgonomyces haynaldii]